MKRILIFLLLSAPLCAMKRVPKFTKEDFAKAQQLVNEAKRKKVIAALEKAFKEKYKKKDYVFFLLKPTIKKEDEN